MNCAKVFETEGELDHIKSTFQATIKATQMQAAVKQIELTTRRLDKGEAEKMLKCWRVATIRARVEELNDMKMSLEVEQRERAAVEAIVTALKLQSENDKSKSELEAMKATQAQMNVKLVYTALRHVMGLRLRFLRGEISIALAMWCENKKLYMLHEIERMGALRRRKAKAEAAQEAKVAAAAEVKALQHDIRAELARVSARMAADA